MGITARGAWESVKRHFRELGVDIQEQDFTVVGIGDMSGDVFGNGMLLSQHIRLVAAFDHRHVFIDPRPRSRRRRSPSASGCSTCRGRAGTTTTARSSPRAAASGRGRRSRSRSRPRRGGPRHRRRGADPGRADPRASCRPPSTCCGTAASAPTSRRRPRRNADVGDQANDAVRVNGRDLRCKVVGEGGNLGFTQRGRIEYARAAASSTPTPSTTRPASTPPTTR